MSSVNVADLVRLAEVDSANLHVYELLGSPAAVLGASRARRGR